MLVPLQYFTQFPSPNNILQLPHHIHIADQRSERIPGPSPGKISFAPFALTDIAVGIPTSIAGSKVVEI